MMRIFALLLCFLPLPVWAEIVLLRSGEHADFSRLVLQLTGQPEWKIGRVEQGYELRIEAEDVVLDTSQVFERIPRDRITQLETPAPSRLVIKVSKGYHLDAFEIRAGRIVIDVKDGSAPANSSFEVTLASESDALKTQDAGIETAPTQQSNLAMFDQSASSILKPHDETLPSIASEKRVPTTATLPLFSTSLGEGIQAPIPLELSPERSERVVQMEAALIEQLGRAASQGLIIADIDDPQADIQEIIAPKERINRAGTLPTDPPPGDLSHVRVKTRVDLDAREAVGKSELTSTGEECLLASKFDISRWGPEMAPYLDLSDYRGALIGEFDVADSEAVLDLARYYIFLSFGAEAKSTLREFGVIVQDADLLAAMAEIVDQGHVSELGRLKGQISCNRPSAMWAVLGSDKISKGDEINRAAVLQAFSALPLHLRRHLGPTLSMRFLDIDDTDTASTIRNAIRRAPGNDGDGYDMLDAKLELSLGHQDVATQKLETLVREGGSLSSEALATLIKTKLSEGEQVSEAMAEDALAVSFSLQNTPLGAELLRVSIAATIQNGDSKKALDQVARAQRDQALESDSVSALLNDAYLGFASSASDIEFMRRTLSSTGRLDIAMLTASPRRAIAGRMLDLGFAVEAREILSAVQDIPTPEDRILFARASLMQGRAQVAVGYLAGIEGEEANFLRAQAFQAAKDEVRAAQVFESLDKINEAARSAWRGGDYSRIERIGSPQEQTVASLANEQPPKPELGLATNRALVAQSAASREALRALIRSLPNP